ncbi:MAG TPA: DUF5719 family protein [Acidimicrobiales bacterium]|nr:DUF5719 family protein [Acidimicrobiales bacterium]
MRRGPLLVVCAVVLGGVGAAVTLRPARNPAAYPGEGATTAQSTALYCTGLSGGAHRPGRVTFVNTAAASRALEIEVVSDTGHVATRSVTLAARTQYSLQPSTLESGTFYAVLTRVAGGGVVAEEVAGTDAAAAPCASAGTTSWSATGFSTAVGSSAYVSVFNPTATAAVFDVSVYSATGFSAPQAFQGVSVPAHAEVYLDLARVAVNARQVGVGLRVLRGTLVVVGVQDSAGTLSLNAGQAAPATRSYFPAVTTAHRASAVLEVANPGPNPAEVTVHVVLGAYAIADQYVSVAPYSTGALALTPNPAIPAAGYAAVSVRSSVPVVTDLATGTAGVGSALSAPSPTTTSALVHDFTSKGYDALRVLNPSRRAITVTVSALGSSRALAHLRVEGHGVGDLALAVPAMRSGPGTYLVASPGRFALGLTLPSRPAGIAVLAALDGR